jgi:DNA repair protein RadC
MRTWQVREASGPAVKVSADFAAAFDELRQADRECFFVVTLNQRHRIIDRYLVAVGTLSEALVHAREVFKPALRDSAAAVALMHNHPSGDPTPSPEDRALTSRLKQAAELLGIRLLDHIVLGRDSHVSFAEDGLL